ncbi:ATP-binding protein [Sulfurimonas sp. HSL-1716]|uniref:PAS domain-containing hybrid sensor histidine kinase/response regulator n=1 Tax=Hydrocurvibacter sulfurireducens TaxID=3131937 RepID=UPI0031F8B30D
MSELLNLKSNISTLENGKSSIISKWMQHSAPQSILMYHNINRETFVKDYAGPVFDYFMGVIKGLVQIGDCPVIADFLRYLKDRNISSKELFTICSHFKLSMVEYSYETQINTKELFSEISYVFDKNFSKVLEIYSETIYEKDIEIGKNVELLEQYIYALNESALVSKTDQNGFITHVNSKFVTLCGYEENELIGRSHNIMRHEDMSKAFFKKLWETIQSNQIFTGTIKNKSKDGSYFYIDTTIMPIEDPFSGKKEYMAIGYEVTKLIDARQKAIEADKAKDYFLSNMSHEIRTPLNAILGFVSLLKDENMSTKHKNYLDIIHNSGENLLNIINDILDFSKLRSGEFTIEPKIFNLEEVLSRTMELFVASANQKQITIISFIDPTIPSEILADQLRLGQIVSNFLSNAIKFTPINGIVEVDATYEDGTIKISVEDSGVGIAKRDIKKIFEAFTQAQNSVIKRSGGTGLGLSICKQLAEIMGGHIEVESTIGHGSRFTLHLPVVVVNSDILSLDCKMLQDKHIAFFVNDKTDTRKLDIFKKYYDQINIKLNLINDIKQSNYDLLYFMDSDLDDADRYKVIQKNRPSIAIMEYMDDSYDLINSISNLCFPVYLTKLRDRTLDALGLKEAYNKRKSSLKNGKNFSGHILVAEDNEANQELIKIILDKYGVTYDIASDGVEAVAMFKDNRYDLVLMDDQMPIKNGFEAVDDIRYYEKSCNLKRTPISTLTANVVKGCKEKSLKCGCDYFLGKPIILKELEAVFERFLETVDEQESESDFDIESLKDELQLDSEQLKMLLEIYIKKMDETLPKLKDEIFQNNYYDISRLAHSVKGSSANFRLENMQKYAHELEINAKEENEIYHYEECMERIEKEYMKIKNF